MCLAIPGKVVAIKKKKALIDYGDEEREADISLVDCQEGDYVLVSNRIVIDTVPPEEAEASLKMYRDAVS